MFSANSSVVGGGRNSFAKWGKFLVVAALILSSGFFVIPNASAVVSTINLTSPVGGEHLNDGVHITWTAVGASGDLADILWSTNDFTTSTNLTVSGVAYNLGSYDWNTVAAGITTDVSTYKIRVQERGGAVQSSSPTNFRIDNVVPTISSATTYDTDLNGTVDKATIIFSEPVRDSSFSATNFTINGQAGSSIDTGGTPNDNTFDVLFTTVIGTGVKNVIYTAGGGTDMATPGNALATVTVGATDGAKPVFLSAKTKTTTAIEATFSEDLSGATVNTSGSEFTVSGYAVSAAHETTPGIVTLTVATMPTGATPNVTFTNTGTFADLAGNQAVTPITKTATDGTAPTLSAVHIQSNNTNPTFAKVGDTVTVSFTSSETIGTPTVTIAGHASVTPTALHPGANDWQATYVIISGDTEGLVTFSISFSDTSSNPGVAVSVVGDASSVTFDKTNPLVSITTPAANSVTTVNNVNAVFVVIDINPGNCAYTIDGGASTPIACVGASITALTDGRRVLNLTAMDAAGNSASANVSFVINLDANLTVGTGKDFTTIQTAVDKATTGDTLAIDAGTYAEDVTINGKNLTLTGTGGAVTAASFTLANTSVSGSTGVTAPIVNVNPGAKIQDGVLLTSSGGTITVVAGTYTESLTINKGVTLQGAGSSSTTITGAQTVTANNVTVDGFTLNGGVTINDAANSISGGTISHNFITGAQNGIRIGSTDTGFGVNNVTIHGNTITANTNRGILFFNRADYAAQGVSNVTIDGNEITNNTNGVAVGGGISTYGPGPNTITNNTVTGNNGNGISIKYDNGDTVTGNTVSNNTAMGINMHQVTNSTVENNIVSGQVSTGVQSTFWGGSITAGKGSAIYIHENSHDNTIRLNTLIDNKIGVLINKEVAGTDPANNSINHNTIDGNTVYGVLNALVSPASPADATPNWWGAVSGPYHSPENTAGTGNAVSDHVIFSPWCTNIGCTTFGSSDPLNHFNVTPSAASSVVGTPITLTVTAKDAADITRVNDTSIVSMAADHGASLGALLLTLVDGIKTTTVNNSVTGTVNISAIKVSDTITGTAQVTFTQSDTGAPTIISHTPADNMTGIAISVSPYIDFSEPLKATTVNSANIQLKKYSDNSAVSATISLVEGGTRVIITPLSQLANNTRYYFAVSTGVKDEVGNPLASALDAGTKDLHEFMTAELAGIVLDDVVPPSPATANSTYLSGWHYIFRITVNNPDETKMFVRFADWLNTAADPDATVEVNGNTKLLFNSGAGVGITEADIAGGFSLGNLFSEQAPGAVDLNSIDNNLDKAGRQVQFDVFTKLPVETVSGFYASEFGICTVLAGQTSADCD